MKHDYYKKLKTTPADNSEIHIEGEIPSTILQEAYDAIYKIALKEVKIPGFREGKAPEHIAKENINSMAILDRAAEEVFKKEYPEIIKNLELFPVDRPKIQITKIAPGNPLGFKIEVPVMPKIELPDYKKITKETNADLAKKDETKAPEASEDEINQAIEEVRKMWAHQEYHKEHHEHADEESFDHLMPEVDDEFVKKVGPFKDVADFREKIKQNILSEKEKRQNEKRRLAILENLTKVFTTPLPAIFIEEELDKMVNDLKNRVSSAGITPADYFKQIEKTEEGIRQEWKEEARKRVVGEILLTEIAKKESLKPDSARVEEDVKALIAHYKDTKEETVRPYVEHMLTNEKVFEFLEKLS